MYIGDYLARRELYSPDRLAIIDTGQTPEWRLTFRQMNARANRLANWLRDVAGVGRGDRPATLAAPSPSRPIRRKISAPLASLRR